MIRNKLVQAVSSVLAAALKHDKVQGVLVQSFERILTREETQGYIDRVLDRYLGRELTKMVMSDALSSNPGLQKQIWKASNIRPLGADTHWAAIPNSIREYRMIEATREAGAFIQTHIPHLEGKKDAFETLTFALEAVDIEGEYIEFGVFSGTTITHIANHLGEQTTVHGFDSFEGLPEDWGAAAKGIFDTQGMLPPVPDNVMLHKGWFDETIEPFLQTTDAPIAFLHADADLYSSTQTILDQLKDRIVTGTVIVFDELINYPYWRDHEYKAFMEFIDATGHTFDYIAYTDRGYSVAVKITS